MTIEIARHIPSVILFFFLFGRPAANMIFWLFLYHFLVVVVVAAVATQHSP